MATVLDAGTTVESRGFRNLVVLFGPTLFLSAFLLFCFEPMVGKMMLPLLGGAASVWITCLLFFQLMLLTVYGYAHVLERYANLSRHIVVHSIMMAAVFMFLPVHFSVRPDQAASAHPSAWLLWQLIKTVGIPFCVVSTTAPLLQNWLSKTGTASGRDPYFLYAISNAGSLIALLTYPLLIEPRIGVRTQSWTWLAGYGALVVMVLAASVLVWTRNLGTHSGIPEPQESPECVPKLSAPYVTNTTILVGGGIRAIGAYDGRHKPYPSKPRIGTVSLDHPAS